MSRARWLFFPIALYLCLVSVGYATPPAYTSFGRAQETEPTPPPADSEIVKIWVIYIGQGDSILIQLPGDAEPIDILVDGGPSGRQLLTFLRSLYPDPTTIEHVVLSHHDSDHVAGLTALIEDDHFSIERIYHNGIASWAQGAKDFPPNGWPPSAQAVFDTRGGQAMALLEADGATFEADYLIDDLAEIVSEQAAGQLVRKYGEFAHAIADEAAQGGVTAFQLAHRGTTIIDDAAGLIPDDVTFQALWPRTPPRKYRQWSYSINGNSLTFKLNYGEFSMLFTGDHNEDSEEDWLDLLEEEDDLAVLEADVLKVPHHGSKHNTREFFEFVDPIVGVASMGSRGFRPSWGHPAEEVIQWLGGSHRVYSTFIHERRFRYRHMGTEAARDSMKETSHVVIETDGTWFRIVETEDPTAIKTVRETRRGDGTRWICAGEDTC